MASIIDAIQTQSIRGQVANQIKCLPNVYLGRGEAAKDIEWLKTHEINSILNVADDVPNFYPKKFNYCNLKVSDFGTDKGISRVFEKAVEFVLECSNNGDFILIHCANGSNRSATVVVALIMRLCSFDLRNAWTELLKYRFNVFPLKDNQRELMKFENNLRSTSSMQEADFAIIKSEERRRIRKEVNLSNSSVGKEFELMKSSSIKRKNKKRVSFGNITVMPTSNSTRGPSNPLFSLFECSDTMQPEKIVTKIIRYSCSWLNKKQPGLTQYTHNHAKMWLNVLEAMNDDDDTIGSQELNDLIMEFYTADRPEGSVKWRREHVIQLAKEV
jgi:protein-tyrosine phosphatase